MKSSYLSLGSAIAKICLLKSEQSHHAVGLSMGLSCFHVMLLAQPNIVSLSFNNAPLQCSSRIPQQHSRTTSKPGAKPKLGLEDRILVALEYWREYRTYFHMGSKYIINFA